MIRRFPPLRGIVLAFALAVFGGLASPGRAAETYWQVVLDYGPGGVRATEVAEMPPLTKKVRTPGLAGAPLRIDCEIEWLDAAGKRLAATEASLPVGRRVPMGGGSACGVEIPDSGSVLIRIPGPDASVSAKALRISRTGISRHDRRGGPVPDAFSPASIVVPVEAVRLPGTVPQPPPGPQGVAKIRDTGPDSNRLTLVVLGDGYTAANLSSGSYASDTNTLLAGFEGKEFWADYFNATNVYRIDVESNESGADRETSPSGPFRDTYFNSTFFSFGIDRLLTIDATGESRARAAADQLVGTGVWDYLFVIVNSEVYGGSGGPISVSSVADFAEEIIVHEFGHTFAGLADEYEDPFPGFPEGDPEPNVDFDPSGSRLKWLVWVENGTPLPTPEEPSFANVVGTFEGARYLTRGIYRPYLDCMMRSIGLDFCPVCTEANALEYWGSVQIAEGVSPAASSTIDLPPGGTTFRVNGPTISTIRYDWTLDGEPVAGANGPTLHLTPEAVGAGRKPLRVVVSNPTSLVRKETLPTRSFNWTVGGSDAPPRLANLSTRGFVGTGADVMIGGIIVGGTEPRRVLVSAVGPDLANFGITNFVPNPDIALLQGATVIASNDDWRSFPDVQAIVDSGRAPNNDLEAAVIATLAPGEYTAVVSGVGGTQGVGLVQAFDLGSAATPALANLSTRLGVGSGDRVLIAGFIVEGSGSKRLLVRGLGPTLSTPPFNLSGTLANPTLALFDATQTLRASNDDWRQSADAAAIEATNRNPPNDLEPAILVELPPGAYTAVVSGAGGTEGIALVEVYEVD